MSAPKHCTITLAASADRDVCGAPAVVAWVNSRGEGFGECAEHNTGPAPVSARVGAALVGHHILVPCFTHPTRLAIVSVGRKNVKAVGHMKNGREVVREIAIDEVGVVYPFA